MRAITINELYDICGTQKKKGNGNKKILISSDDEGNEYHELFYGFLEDLKDIDNYQLPFGVNEDNKKDYLILG